MLNKNIKYLFTMCKVILLQLLFFETTKIIFKTTLNHKISDKDRYFTLNRDILQSYYQLDILFEPNILNRKIICQPYYQNIIILLKKTSFSFAISVHTLHVNTFVKSKLFYLKCSLNSSPIAIFNSTKNPIKCHRVFYFFTHLTFISFLLYHSNWGCFVFLGCYY